MSPILASLSSRWHTTAGSGEAWVVDSDGVYNYQKGSITGISDIAAEDLGLLPGNTAFMMRYDINVYGGTQTITAACVRNGAILSQSGLATSNYGSASYVGNSFTQYTQANDDHDGLIMDGNGRYTIAYANNLNRVEYTNRNTYLWAYGWPTQSNSTAYEPWNATQPANDNSKTLVAFPQTGYSVWVEPWDNRIKVGNAALGAQFSRTNTNVGIADQIGFETSTTTLQNNIITMSDSINSFWISRYTKDKGRYIEIDLTDGSVHYAADITFNQTLQHPNSSLQTEEDPFGDQLFAVNGAISWNGGNSSYTFNHNSTTGWREWDGNFSNYSNSFSSSSQGITQSGLDCISGIYNREVYFGDWGHDNGGMFNVGSDDQLGMQKTTIKLLNSTSTPSSP